MQNGEDARRVACSGERKLQPSKPFHADVDITTGQLTVSRCTYEEFGTKFHEHKISLTHLLADLCITLSVPGCDLNQSINENLSEQMHCSHCT